MSHYPTHRAQHLIDIENLVGGPFPAPVDALEMVQHYLTVAGWQPGDLTVLAVNKWLYRRIVFDLPSHIRALPVIGKDGADLALLGWTNPDDVAHRFGRLVVGSGDGLFTDLVAGAAALGVDTCVVTGFGGLSRRLAAAATETLTLPGPDAAAA